MTFGCGTNAVGMASPAGEAPRSLWSGDEVSYFTTHQSFGLLHFTLRTASLTREAIWMIAFMSYRAEQFYCAVERIPCYKRRVLSQ